MTEWAERFDAQIFLHAADREWIMRKSRRIQFWEGTTLPLWDGLILINCSGHFEGGTVLHWPAGANGQGALLTGDIITVVQDHRYVSFMRSYPNLIPLGAAAIHRILERIEPFSFEQIYGGWWKANVLADAKAAVARTSRVPNRESGVSSGFTSISSPPPRLARSAQSTIYPKVVVVPATITRSQTPRSR